MMLRIFKAISIGVSVLSLSGCLGDPMTQLDLMTGSGTLNQSPDGKVTFRYAVNANAWNGTGLSPQEVEDAHLTALGNFLASQSQCSDGYKVTEKAYVEEGPTYVYSGNCL